MSFEAKVLADSVDMYGNRLTTLQETYPRIIHAERMTHRIHSKNSASTRAIPLSNQLKNLLENPFVPERFGINQPGMQAYAHLEGMKHNDAVEVWLAGRDRALTTTTELILGRTVMADIFNYDPNKEFVSGDQMLEKFDDLKAAIPKSSDQVDLGETSMLNVHKQLAGRGLEAYMWHTIVVSGTEWGNYLALRDHEAAQGEIATIARLGRQALADSTPKLLQPGEWHLPFVQEGEFEDTQDAIKASVARAAATSYNRQDARNFEREVTRYNDLRRGGHMSPFEHQGTPFSDQERYVRMELGAMARVFADREGLNKLAENQIVESTQYLGNFKGWRQHRKDIEGEDDFSKLLEAANQ